MSIFKKSRIRLALLAALATSIAAVLLTAAVNPAEVTTTRELEVFANADVIFPFINNVKKSYQWMPWADGDPGIEIQFSGPEEGVGSTSSWNGKQMGVGTSVVVESITNQVVRTQLDYTKPFEMHQLAEVSLTPTSRGTLVKWSATGHANFFFRLLRVFIDLDKIVGEQFDKGLSRLKVLAENQK